jgi:hypothetical protein
MPLTRVKTNIATRFNSVLINLRHLEAEERLIHSIEIVAADKPNENVHKIQKGLYFVHLYSAFEKSLNEIVERCLLYIESKGVTHQHYALPFNSIALDANLMSLKAAGKDRMMECSISLFATMGGNSHTRINEVMFGAKLQNVWFDTLKQTIECFGARNIPDPTGTLKTSIDEVVDKRNAVAHGRIPADRVGERQSCETLQVRTSAVQTTLNLVIDSFEQYLANREFIAPQFTENYP